MASLTWIYAVLCCAVLCHAVRAVLLHLQIKLNACCYFSCFVPVTTISELDVLTGAAWAAIEYPDADIRCITFGSPRVANKVFGKAFNALVGTSLRLVYGFDPVPALPPSLM